MNLGPHKDKTLFLRPYLKVGEPENMQLALAGL